MADSEEALEFANQRISLAQSLGEKFGVKKINLVRHEGWPRSEGVWCVPVTEDDNRKLLDDNSSDEKVRVYLANMPLPWNGRCWGAEVIGTTRGRERPIALPEDQTPLDAEVRLLYEGLAIYAANNPKPTPSTTLH
jgi:hypothetical protein